jgi:hypothetical protein
MEMLPGSLVKGLTSTILAERAAQSWTLLPQIALNIPRPDVILGR